jgi:hypothetical protein
LSVDCSGTDKLIRVGAAGDEPLASVDSKADCDAESGSDAQRSGCAAGSFSGRQVNIAEEPDARGSCLLCRWIPAAVAEIPALLVIVKPGVTEYLTVELEVELVNHAVSFAIRSLNRILNILSRHVNPF